MCVCLCVCVVGGEERQESERERGKCEEYNGVPQGQIRGQTILTKKYQFDKIV